MGINSLTVEFERKSLKLAGKKYEGLKWCELGCQKDLRYGIPSKFVYRKLGVDHKSIDINGRFGSIKIDLNKPIPKRLEKGFDVVTDYGTAEHITNQHSLFKNIHDLCRSNGVMIHALPLKDNWKNHGLYEYSREFFKGLAKICNYSILNIEILNKDKFCHPYEILAVTLKKNSERFPPEIKFRKLALIQTKFEDLTEDYEKKGIYHLLSSLKADYFLLKWILASRPV